MNEAGKSDSPVVPAKPPNKAEAAEVVEGRELAKGNTIGAARPERRDGVSVPQGLDRVREAAQRDKAAQFTALLHHIDEDRLRACYGALNPKAAPGVDQITWATYGENLEGNLRDLHQRVHRGSYRAQPSRRVYIPKADGQRRSLGIAALEDKIVQRAAVEVMNAIYETEFLGFSYGCRPGRGPHMALDALATGIVRKKVCWVLDADIRDFFTSFDHSRLMGFIERRIGDKRLLRLIQKWLRAGVVEDGNWLETDRGVMQGASVSPLLANIYLHDVFDQWAHQWRMRNARGEMVIVRYVDDIVVGFERREDAVRFHEDLRERLEQFALELHPEKTRLIEFGRFAAERREERGLGKPETFDFLGFTHISGKTRNGKFKLQRITTRKRMKAKLKQVKDRLQRCSHLPIPVQGRWLSSVLRGHYGYYAVQGNSYALSAFRHQVTLLWLGALRRRSHKHRLPWTRMDRLATRWLPRPTILHPSPLERFDATTRGRSPVR